TDVSSCGLLDETLYTAAEALRIITALLYPVIPDSAAKIWSQMGFTSSLSEIRTRDLHWGRLHAGQLLGAVSPVFPRAEAKPSIDRMRELETEEYARQQALLGKKVPATPAAAAADGKISIDEFVKIDMRVGIVKDAAVVKGSDKLLHLHVD